MTIKEMVQDRLVKVERTIDYASNKLKTAPEGSLFVRKVNGKLRYFNREQSVQTNGRYLGSGSMDKIKALEEKAYLQSVRRAAEEEKQALQKIQKLLEEITDVDGVYLRIPREKRHLIQPMVFEQDSVTEEELESWSRNSRNTNNYQIRNNLVSLNNEKMRSKSEVIIADRLKAAGIPYHYEPELPIVYEEHGQFVRRFADFKVLNVRTGQILYWEHLGYMDDEGYRSSSLEKIEKYAERGIVQGKNLIVTMETMKHPLNTRYVDRIINEFLK